MPLRPNTLSKENLKIAQKLNVLYNMGEDEELMIMMEEVSRVNSIPKNVWACSLWNLSCRDCR